MQQNTPPWGFTRQLAVVKLKSASGQLYKQGMVVEMDKKNNGDLEAKLKFSWGRVFSRWGKNLMDDLDPAYKGAKIGWYTIHGIPSMIRESREWKLETDSKGWTTFAGIVTFGACATGYVLGTIGMVHAYGEKGFALLGLPIAAQGASYVYEAFRRAHKSELKNVVITKVQNSLDNKCAGEFNLSNKELLESAADDLSQWRGSTIYDWHELFGTSEEKETFHQILGNRGINAFNDMSFAEKIFPEKRVKEMAYEIAKHDARRFAENIFNCVYTDHIVGKVYEMAPNGVAGVKKRVFKKLIENDDDENTYEVMTRRFSTEIKGGQALQFILEKIKQVVEANKGTANIELLGQVTAVYGTEDGKASLSHYKVEPNSLWKK